MEGEEDLERALRDAGDAKCRMPAESELDEALEELMAEILDTVPSA